MELCLQVCFACLVAIVRPATRESWEVRIVICFSFSKSHILSSVHSQNEVLAQYKNEKAEPQKHKKFNQQVILVIPYLKFRTFQCWKQHCCMSCLLSIDNLLPTLWFRKCFLILSIRGFSSCSPQLTRAN